MGANTPKTELDREYRRLVSEFLETIRTRHGLNKTELGERLGKDRASASRYLAGKQRAPLHVLQFLFRTLRESVPHEVEEAFWASEPQSDRGPRKTA